MATSGIQTDAMNFAVIGCGALARGQHIPNISRSDRAVLHTCCDVSQDTLAECRDQFQPRLLSRDYEEVIADPDVEVIVLATNETLRLPVIQACAEAGKPVYVEKPLAGTLDELREIQRVVRGAGILLCVGHNRRCAPAMIDAWQIFRRHMSAPEHCPWRFDREGPHNRPQLPDDGAATMSVRINDDWHSWKGWVFDKAEMPHGPMIFEMTHFTDLCNWFLDAEPVQVVALESGMLNHGVVIRYEHGEIATITMGANGTFGYPKELYEIFGSGGVVVVDHMLEVRTAGIAGAPDRLMYDMLTDRHPHVGEEGGLAGWLEKKRTACREATEQSDPELIFTAEADKGHARALEAFMDQIHGARTELCGLDDAVLATRVALAAVHSAETGRVVDLHEI